MENYQGWNQAVQDWFHELSVNFLNFLPDLFSAVIILFLGWIAARLLRAVTSRGTRSLEHLLTRLVRLRGFENLKVPHLSSELLGSIVFWIVIFLALTAVTQVLGLTAFSQGLQRVLTFLPTLLVGGLIILAGYLVSLLVRDLFVSASPAAFRENPLLARLLQFMVLATAVVIGVDQIGIDVSFLIILASLVLASISGGAALAVSLGARTLVSNLIGSHYFRQTCQVGQTVKIGGYEGRILDLTATMVVLESDEGRVVIPARVFQEEPVILRMNRESHD